MSDGKLMKFGSVTNINIAERCIGASAITSDIVGNVYMNLKADARKISKLKERSRKNVDIDKYISEIHRLFNLNPKENLRYSSLIGRYIRDLCENKRRELVFS